MTNAKLRHCTPACETNWEGLGSRMLAKGGESSPMFRMGQILGTVGTLTPTGMLARAAGRTLAKSAMRRTAERAAEKALGPRFVPGKWLPHFEKHGAEFGYKNSMEYLKGARDLVGREGVETFTRANGDRLFYDAARNEFAAMRPDGVLRTYFRPKTGDAYWKGQTGG